MSEVRWIQLLQAVRWRDCTRCDGEIVRGAERDAWEIIRGIMEVGLIR
jgi:hypothetical protein